MRLTHLSTILLTSRWLRHITSLALASMLWQCTYDLPQSVEYSIHSNNWQSSRTTAPADGYSTIEVTLQLTDKQQQPVAHVPVQWLRNEMPWPTPMQSDEQGRVVLSVTATQAEQVVLAAIVTLSNQRTLRINHDQILTFVAGQPQMFLVGDAFSAPAGQSLTLPLAVRASDGLALPSFPCTWQIDGLPANSNALLPNNESFTTDASGVMTASATFYRAGSYALQLHCTNWPHLAPVQQTVTITPQTMAQAALLEHSAPLSLEASVALQAIRIRLQAQDAYGNPTTAIPAVSSLLVTDSKDNGLTNPLALGWQNNESTLSFDSNRWMVPGPVTLAIRAGMDVLPVIPSQLTTIVPGAAQQLQLMAIQGNANQWIDVQLVLSDSLGNPIPGTGGLLSLTSDCPGASFAPIPPSLTDSAGSILLPAAYRCPQPGSYSLMASWLVDGTPTLPIETSLSHTINSYQPYFALAPSHTGPYAVGTSITVHARLLDEDHNALLLPDPLAIDWSAMNSGQATPITNQVISLNANNTFALTIPSGFVQQAGDAVFRLQTTDGSIVGWMTISLAPGAASSLQIQLEQSTNLTACRAFPITVQAFDAFNNPTLLADVNSLMLSLDGGDLDGVLRRISPLQQNGLAYVGQLAISQISAAPYLLTARTIDNQLISPSVQVEINNSSVRDNTAMGPIVANNSAIIVPIQDVCTAKVRMTLQPEGETVKYPIALSGKISDIYQGPGWIDTLGKQHLWFAYNIRQTLGNVPQGQYTLHVTLETPLSDEPITESVDIQIPHQQGSINPWQATSNTISGHDIIASDSDADGLDELYIVPHAFLEPNNLVSTQLADIQPENFANHTYDPRGSIIANGFNRNKTLIADINHDGVLDLIACYNPPNPSPLGGRWVIHLGQAQSGELQVRGSYDLNVNESCLDLQQAFLDNNPWPEIILHTDSRLLLLSNPGDPNQSGSTLIPTPLSLPGFLLADVQIMTYPVLGRGMSDLVVIDPFNPTIAIFARQNEFGFSSAPTRLFNLTGLFSVIEQVQWAAPPQVGLLNTFPALVVGGQPEWNANAQGHLAVIDLRANQPTPMQTLPEGKPPFVAVWHAGTSQLQVVATPMAGDGTNPNFVHNLWVQPLLNPTSGLPLFWLKDQQHVQDGTAIGAIQNNTSTLATLKPASTTSSGLLGTSLLPTGIPMGSFEQLVMDFDQDGWLDTLFVGTNKAPLLHLGYDEHHMLPANVTLMPPSTLPASPVSLIAIDGLGMSRPMPLLASLNANQLILHSWPLPGNGNMTLVPQSLALELPSPRLAADSNLLLAKVPTRNGRTLLWVAYTGTNGPILAWLDMNRFPLALQIKALSGEAGRRPLELISQDINLDGLDDLQLTTGLGTTRRITAWLTTTANREPSPTPWITYEDSSAISTVLLRTSPQDQSTPQAWFMDTSDRLVGKQWLNSLWVDMASPVPTALTCLPSQAKRLTWWQGLHGQGIAATCRETSAINALLLVPNLSLPNEQALASAPQRIHHMEGMDMTGEGCQEILMFSGQGLALWRGQCDSQGWQGLQRPNQGDDFQKTSQDVMVAGLNNAYDPQLVTLGGTSWAPNVAHHYQRHSTSDFWQNPNALVGATSSSQRYAYANLSLFRHEHQSVLLASGSTLTSFAPNMLDGPMVQTQQVGLNFPIKTLVPLRWSHHSQPVVAVLQQNISPSQMFLNFYNTTANGEIQSISALLTMALGQDSTLEIEAAQTFGDKRQQLLYYSRSSNTIGRITFQGLQQPQTDPNWLSLRHTVQDLRLIAQDVDDDGQSEILAAYRTSGKLQLSLFQRTRGGSLWNEQTYTLPQHLALHDEPVGLDLFQGQRSGGADVLLLTGKSMLHIQLPASSLLPIPGQSVTIYPLLQVFEQSQPVRPAIMDVDFNGTPDVLLGVGRTFGNTGNKSWLPAQIWRNRFVMPRHL